MHGLPHLSSSGRAACALSATLLPPVQPRLRLNPSIHPSVCTQACIARRSSLRPANVCSEAMDTTRPTRADEAQCMQAVLLARSAQNSTPATGQEALGVLTHVNCERLMNPPDFEALHIATPTFVLTP